MKVKDFIEMLSKHDLESEIVTRGEETCEWAWDFQIMKASDYLGGEDYADELAEDLQVREVLVLDFEYPEIKKCSYCDFEYETLKKYRNHLEDKHHKMWNLWSSI